jgi:hypothetical protein
MPFAELLKGDLHLLYILHSAIAPIFIPVKRDRPSRRRSPLAVGWVEPRQAFHPSPLGPSETQHP